MCTQLLTHNSNRRKHYWQSPARCKANLLSSIYVQRIKAHNPFIAGRYIAVLCRPTSLFCTVKLKKTRSSLIFCAFRCFSPTVSFVSDRILYVFAVVILWFCFLFLLLTCFIYAMLCYNCMDACWTYFVCAFIFFGASLCTHLFWGDAFHSIIATVVFV